MDYAFQHFLRALLYRSGPLMCFFDRFSYKRGRDNNSIGPINFVAKHKHFLYLGDGLQVLNLHAEVAAPRLQLIARRRSRCVPPLCLALAIGIAYLMLSQHLDSE